MKNFMKHLCLFSVLVCLFVAGSHTELYAATKDAKAPAVNLTYSVLNQEATVSVDASDDSGIKSIEYLKGEVKDSSSEQWTGSNTLFDTTNFKVKSSGLYSVLVTDLAGNKTVETINIKMEMKAVWISYLEFNKKGYTESQFKKHIDEMFDNSVDLNMNTVIVQVRPICIWKAGKRSRLRSIRIYGRGCP